MKWISSSTKKENGGYTGIKVSMRVGFLIFFISFSLQGSQLLFRDSKKAGWMEIAIGGKGNFERSGRAGFLIYSFPRRGNPAEKEIAMYFAKDMPFRISGVYAVATVTPKENGQGSSEKCDLYFVSPIPALKLSDAVRVGEEIQFGDAGFRYPDREELQRNLLLKTIFNDLFCRMFVGDGGHYGIPFEVKAWLDEKGEPILDRNASAKRLEDGSRVSGLLIRAHLDLSGKSVSHNVKVTGEILDYLKVRKSFAVVEKDKYSNSDGFTVYQDTSFRNDHGNSVLEMIANKNLSCFNLSLVDGTFSVRDGIDLREWRVVKGSEAFNVKVEVVRIRAKGWLEERIGRMQPWQIMLLLVFLAAIAVFFVMQFLFVKHCGWSALAWTMSAGMSLFVVAFFYSIPSPNTSLLFNVFPFAFIVYLILLAGALLYSFKLKRKAAIGAVSVIVLETVVLSLIVHLLGHAGG